MKKFYSTKYVLLETLRFDSSKNFSFKNEKVTKISFSMLISQSGWIRKFQSLFLKNCNNSNKNENKNHVSFINCIILY